MSLNYAWPREVPLPRGGFDLCDGPAALGTPEDFSTRWAVWIATDGIRIGAWNGQVMDDIFGQTNDLFTGGERPAKVSMCFDPLGNQMIAIQQDATTIAVRVFVAGIPTEYTFAGLSPVAFNNLRCMPDDTDYDVGVLYLKSAGDTIFIRLLRDNFVTEYSLNPGLNSTLVELMKTDTITINTGAGDDVHHALWAMTDDGQPVFMRKFYRHEGGIS